MISVVEFLLGGEFRRWTHALGVAIGKAQTKHDGCEIPETQCPPRCVGSIVWSFGREATPTASVTVRNVGSESRTFDFQATPLAGSQVGSARVTVSPTAATLAAGSSVVVDLRLEGSAELSAGQEYRAEFRFKGAWEQCVFIDCRVAPDESVNGDVEQGDTPPGIPSVKASFEKAKPAPTIIWQVERGVTPQAHIAISNTGTGRREFKFSTTPLVGLDAHQAELSLSTARVELAPREHAVLHVQLKNTAALGPCQEYHAALLIVGFTEDRIAIGCTIKRDPAAHVDVSQGDFPTRLRAHHWYDHFQCTVPCASASTPAPNTDSPSHRAFEPGS